MSTGTSVTGGQVICLDNSVTFLRSINSTQEIGKVNKMCEENTEQFQDHVRMYLRFLHDEDGWSDLIDDRWKDEVYEILKKRFPEMTDQEWKVLEELVFY